MENNNIGQVPTNNPIIDPHNELPAPRKKGISFSAGILTILVVSAILFGGVFAYQYFANKNIKVVEQNPAPITQGSTQSNEVASWKTYTNTEYGFEIKHPNTWGIFQTWNLATDGVGGVILGYRGDGDYFGIDIQVSSSKGKFNSFSNTPYKKLIERNGIWYLIYPNNISEQEFNQVFSTFKFTK